MTKYTIEIEGLPEGWEAVAYRVPHSGDMYLRDRGIICQSDGSNTLQYLIVQKTKPRRIVLEETGEYRRCNPGEWYQTTDDSAFYKHNAITRSEMEYKIWRIKEE